MHRRHLIELLNRYSATYPMEEARVEQFRRFVEEYPDCFERSCVPGHITASAWIISSDGDDALLTHHAKLGRWLQLGGHADGDTDPFRVALREAREESGMGVFAEPSGTLVPLPLDVDIHQIPPRPGEPAHLHHDLRYLLVAGANQELVVSEESADLRWVARCDLASFTDEESVLRLDRKARLLLGEDRMGELRR